MSAPGTRKWWSISVRSAIRTGENKSPKLCGRRKKRDVRIAVITPTSEPKVPGAIGAYPTPSAVPIAYARFGFCLAASVDGVIWLSWRVCLAVGFVKLRFTENRVGNGILLTRPQTQLKLKAGLAAKRQIL